MGERVDGTAQHFFLGGEWIFVEATDQTWLLLKLVHCQN